MRQLYYIIRTLIRAKSSVLIKLISLTLGLFVGIILFARIAFDLSYNSSYSNPDRLCAIMVSYTIDGLTDDPGRTIHGPVPYALSEAFPDEIEASSITCNFGQGDFFMNDNHLEGYTVVADTAYFKTMGIAVLSGQTNDLTNPDVAFVSEEFARKAFYGENPIGKTISYGNEYSLTVRGTFRGVPENNSERPDVVISFASLHKYKWRNYTWYGGDSYRGYVRLKRVSDFNRVNDHVQDVIDRHMPIDPEKDGWSVKYSIKPMQEMYTDNAAVRRQLMINTILGIAILLIAALNYVLISISSIVRRAKAIAVHKSNGSTEGDIFMMFIWETLIIVGISLLLVVVLMFNAKALVEDIVQVSLGALFSWHSLWVPALVVVMVVLIAGVIPGKMFSGIPVTQVFRQYKDKKQTWKRLLLFVQFSGVAFVFGLLCVVMLQYRLVLNADQGYKPDGVVYAYYKMENKDAVKSALRHLPMVQALSLSMSPMAYGLSGDFILDDTGRTLFSTRWNEVDKDFVSLMQIHMLEGRNIERPGEALVNEEFVRHRHWTESPIGLKTGSESGEVIVGVMKDFVSSNLYFENQPVLFTFGDDWINFINIRLKEPYDQNLMALNEAAKELFPTNLVVFQSLTKNIENMYDSVRRFRDSVLIAFISIILISLMGLLGYVSDEVQRRSKEIAIRKVNGATAGDILSLLSKDVMWLSLAAIVVGLGTSYFISTEWLSQFAGLQMELGWPLYVLVGLGLFLFVEGVVVVKAWGIANENPVKSIKSE